MTNENTSGERSNIEGVCEGECEIKSSSEAVFGNVEDSHLG